MRHVITGTIHKTNSNNYKVSIFNDQFTKTTDDELEAVEFCKNKMESFFNTFKIPTAVTFKRDGKESVLMYDVEDDNEVEWIEVSLTEYWKQHFFYRKDKFDESTDKGNQNKKDFYVLDPVKSHKLWEEEQEELEEILKKATKEQVKEIAEKYKEEYALAAGQFTAC